MEAQISKDMTLDVMPPTRVYVGSLLSEPAVDDRESHIVTRFRHRCQLSTKG